MRPAISLPRRPGVAAALGAALLFGAGTPLAKALLEGIDAWVLAGLLYLGSGLGLALIRRLRGAPAVKLPAGDWRWLAGAVFAGGVVGPVLLMAGLARLPATSTSLLLNAEAVFTALLAWFVFRENFDRRIAVGMGCIVVGAVVLIWPGAGADTASGALAVAATGVAWVDLWPALAVLGACAAWGLDNNLTRRVALNDAMWVASVKGLAAGTVNLALALLIGSALPPWPGLAGALALGLAAYGISLTLFVVALRDLGTARTGAYFSVAPFFGALLAVVFLGEAVGPQLIAAAALMALGVWLHLTERHAHEHHHETIEHEHEHDHADDHDAHHEHDHGLGLVVIGKHHHRHQHEPLRHSHRHFPDAHHRHRH